MNATSGPTPVHRPQTAAPVAPVHETPPTAVDEVQEVDDVHVVTDLRPPADRKPWPQVPHGAVYAPGAEGADEHGMLAFPGLVPRSIVDAILGRAPLPPPLAGTNARRSYGRLTDPTT